MRRLSRISRILRSNGAVGGQQEVLGDLLGDGRSALHVLAALQEHQAGAQDALGVEAAVGIEVLVLGGDEGVLDQRRNRRRGQIEAPLARIFGQQAAVGRVNARHHRRLVVLQLANSRAGPARTSRSRRRRRPRATTKTIAPVANTKPRKRAMPRMFRSKTLGPDDDPPADRPRAMYRALLIAKRAPLSGTCGLRRRPRVHVGRDCGETMKPARTRGLRPADGPRRASASAAALCPAARISQASAAAVTCRTRRARPPLGGRRAVRAGRRTDRRRSPSRSPSCARHSGELIACDVLRVGEIAEFDQHRREIGRLQHDEAGRALGIVVELRRALQLRRPRRAKRCARRRASRAA